MNEHLSFEHDCIYKYEGVGCQNPLMTGEEPDTCICYIPINDPPFDLFDYIKCKHYEVKHVLGKLKIVDNFALTKPITFDSFVNDLNQWMHSIIIQQENYKFDYTDMNAIIHYKTFDEIFRSKRVGGRYPYDLFTTDWKSHPDVPNLSKTSFTVIGVKVYSSGITPEGTVLLCNKEFLRFLSKYYELAHKEGARQRDLKEFQHQYGIESRSVEIDALCTTIESLSGGRKKIQVEAYVPNKMSVPPIPNLQDIKILVKNPTMRGETPTMRRANEISKATYEKSVGPNGGHSPLTYERLRDTLLYNVLSKAEAKAQAHTESDSRAEKEERDRKWRNRRKNQR